MILFFIIIFLQIILESLPISSSGHLIILQKIFNFQIPEFFDYVLHGPTIFVLMFVFYKEWSFPIYKLFKGFFDKKLSIKQSYKQLLGLFFKIFIYVFISNFVTMFIWFFVKIFLEKRFWFNSDFTLLIGFSVTSILLFALKTTDDNYRFYETNIFKFIILGFVQGMALFPGISRFASVYTAARLLKIPNRRAFEITFLLQFPLIIAGFFLGAYKMFCLPQFNFCQNISITTLLVVFATILSAYFLIWCKKLAIKNKLWLFSFYMFFPISILILFFIL